jgi:hypothetical protein
METMCPAKSSEAEEDINRWVRADRAILLEDGVVSERMLVIGDSEVAVAGICSIRGSRADSELVLVGAASVQKGPE